MSRIEVPASESENEGVPDHLGATPEKLAAGDTQDEVFAPRDTPLAAFEYGTTAREIHDGEPHTLRIEREEPEVLELLDVEADEREGADTPFSAGAGAGVGRLVAPDEGAHSPHEHDLIASDEGTDLGGYSAEEAAMHIEEAP